VAGGRGGVGPVCSGSDHDWGRDSILAVDGSCFCRGVSLCSTPPVLHVSRVESQGHLLMDAWGPKRRVAPELPAGAHPRPARSDLA